MIDSRKDWFELLAHWVGSIIILLAFWWAGYEILGLIINTVLWPGREIIQRYQKGQHWTEIFTRLQPFAEWSLPVATGFLLAYLLP